MSFGPENTQEEVDRLAQALGTATQVLLAGRAVSVRNFQKHPPSGGVFAFQGIG